MDTGGVAEQFDPGLRPTGDAFPQPPPNQPLWFGGLPIDAAVPIGVAEGGNATVYFEVLTYAGTLTISAIIDPEHFPDGDTLAAALETELRAMRDGACLP
jgi:hypothetical protein